MPSLTINYNAQDGQRVCNALGKLRGLRNAQGPRAATEAEVKAALCSVAKGWVEEAERVEPAPVTPPDLT